MKKRSMAAFAAFTFLVFLVLGCQTKRAPTAEDLVGMPVKQLANYPHDFARSVPDRIQEAPEVLLSYLRRIDYDPTYKSYLPNATEKALFRDYFALLPESYRRLLSERLAGVYFLDHFKGGGMADYVFAEDGGLYLIMIFNAEVLRTPLGAWIAERDNSPFATGGDIAAVNGLGAGYQGLIHTLVHEASHAWDYIHTMTPYVERDLFVAANGGKVVAAPPTAFTAGVWADYALPVKAFLVPGREDLSFYGFGTAADPRKEAAFYRRLAATPFTSLYGCGSWPEDFAETFTWLYLREKLGLVYDVEVLRKGELVALFRPLENPLVQKRWPSLKAAIAP
jgi:hypothetical protein